MLSRTPKYNAKLKELLDAATPGERVCPISGELWQMTEEELTWMRKFNVPPTDIAPMVRRRWLNGFNLGVEMWRTKDMLSGKPILSYVHPDNKIPVVEDTTWFEKDWSEVAQVDVDSDKTVFDQMRVLLEKVPVPALRSYNPPINTIGASFISVEDSFMVFAGVMDTKRCSYGWLMKSVEDTQDLFSSYNSTSSFSINHCDRMHNCRVALRSVDCLNSSFLFDCRNCESCFGGFNLRNRKFVFWGEQLSEEEYNKRVSEIDLTSHKTFSEYYQRYLGHLATEAVWPENFNVQTEDCTGEYLTKSVRCHDSHTVTLGKDLFRCQLSHTNCEQACYVSGFANSSELFTCSAMVGSTKCLFSASCKTSQGLEYSMHCQDCENCFGCIGLRNKKFHIFNKPYSEEEYWEKIDEIKTSMLDQGSYGQMLPADFAPAGFQFATDIFFDYPEKELEALKAPKFDPNVGSVQDVDSMVHPEELPDRLEECAAFVGKAIFDPELKRPFAVRKTDFVFYQKLGLPFPRKHYIRRLKTLTRLANTFEMMDVQCAKCQKDIRVAQNLTFKNRKIYCYECYLDHLEQHG